GYRGAALGPPRACFMTPPEPRHTPGLSFSAPRREPRPSDLKGRGLAKPIGDIRPGASAPTAILDTLTYTDMTPGRTREPRVAPTAYGRRRSISARLSLVGANRRSDAVMALHGRTPGQAHGNPPIRHMPSSDKNALLHFWANCPCEGRCCSVGTQ